MTLADRWNDRRQSRGQLLLVGAVVLATVIIGLVVVVNSSLFIENIESPGASGAVTQVSQTDYNLRESVRTVTLRVNHASAGRSAASVGTRVDRNISSLSQLSRLTLVASQSTVVNATYNNSSSTYGTRVVQRNDSYLTDNGQASGAPVWEPVTGQNIGWFVMNVNVSETEATPVVVTVSNSTGDTVVIRVERGTPPEPDLRITSSVNGIQRSSVSCDPTNRRVLLDLRSGEAFAEDGCEFSGTTAITNASTVQFENGENAQARYSLVANDTGAVSGRGRALPDCLAANRDEPCLSPVVWSANITVTVQNSNTDYANSHNVSVYEVNR